MQMEIIVLYLPACASRCSCCSAEQHFPAPAALLVLAHSPGSAGTQTEPWQPFCCCCCCCWGYRDTGTDVWNIPPQHSQINPFHFNCLLCAACHFATDPSFSYRVSEMLAERRDFPLWFFFCSFIASKNQHPFSYLKSSVAILLLLFSFNGL